MVRDQIELGCQRGIFALHPVGLGEHSAVDRVVAAGFGGVTFPVCRHCSDRRDDRRDERDDRERSECRERVAAATLAVQSTLRRCGQKLIDDAGNRVGLLCFRPIRRVAESGARGEHLSVAILRHPLVGVFLQPLPKQIACPVLVDPRAQRWPRVDDDLVRERHARGIEGDETGVGESFECPTRSVGIAAEVTEQLLALPGAAAVAAVVADLDQAEQDVARSVLGGLVRFGPHPVRGCRQ